jgi:hypothetical protein
MFLFLLVIMFSAFYQVAEKEIKKIRIIFLGLLEKLLKMAH